jgi:sulfate transport system permease protein
MTGKHVLRFGALAYLAAILVVPVGFVFWRTFEHGFGPAWDSVTTPEARHALWLTLEIAAITVPANTIFGVVAAMAIVRHRFPGAGVVNALVDLPLALSPVVVGLALLLLYGAGGWLAGHGVLFALPGMTLATIWRRSSSRCPSSSARSSRCCARSARSRSRRRRRSARPGSRRSAA